MSPPILSWWKCNTDGASCGCPDIASCPGVFRDHATYFFGGFPVNISMNIAFHAELLGFINVIEYVYVQG